MYVQIIYGCPVGVCSMFLFCDTHTRLRIYARSLSKYMHSHSERTLQHTATHCNTLQHTATHCVISRSEDTHFVNSCIFEMYAYALSLTHTYTYTYTQTHTHICTHTRTHIHTRAQVRVGELFNHVTCFFCTCDMNHAYVRVT